MTSRTIFRVVMLLAIGVLTFFNQSAEKTTKTPTITKEATSSGGIATASESARVIRVIDGDTIELDDGKKVRYIGIDTPETVDPRKAIMCFGREASEENKKLVGGKMVRLEKDVSDTDRFGRLLRYVYVGEVFVNDYLVRQGYAHASTYPPDVKYQKQFVEAQEYARIQKKGLWSSCK